MVYHNVYLVVCCMLLQVVDVCLRMLSHDPNYNYDSSEGEEWPDDDVMDTEEFDDK